MKGKKCSIIFMRKVANRLEVLEERYKDLSPKQRAGKINEQLLQDFCVKENQLYNWKRVVNIATRHTTDICGEISPSHLMEIARLPDDKIESTINEVKNRKLTVKETKQLVDQKFEKKVPLPKEPFDVIYADPPWKYEVNFLSASPDSHYSTMDIEKICSLTIPSSENSILFLWATNPLLKDALQVMKAWGFNYKTNIVWIKNKIGLGFYVRGQHELLLIGTKGNAHPPEESNRPPSVLCAEVKEHSEKPSQIYEIIEQMYPNSKYLELFARKKRANWVSWGNEIES